jgi:hypothetical protein
MRTRKKVGLSLLIPLLLSCWMTSSLGPEFETPKLPLADENEAILYITNGLASDAHIYLFLGESNLGRIANITAASEEIKLIRPPFGQNWYLRVIPFPGSKYEGAWVSEPLTWISSRECLHLVIQQYLPTSYVTTCPWPDPEISG